MAVHVMAEGWTEDDPQMDVTFKGAVLDTYEVNGHADSDFYAYVWDATQHRTRHVLYATTRGWTYPNRAEVDATPYVRALAAKYHYLSALRSVGAAAVKRARKWHRGDRVRVYKGRKVPVGTAGEAFWVGERYGTTRVGIRQDSGNVAWVDAAHVERDGWWNDPHLHDSRWMARAAYKQAHGQTYANGDRAASYGVVLGAHPGSRANDPTRCEVA